MMFAMLTQDLQRYHQALWIQVFTDHMQLLHADGSLIATQLAQPAYANARSLIANFQHAESNLRQLMQQAQRKWFQSPIAFVQIMQTDELTTLEQQAFSELAYNSTHARQVRLYDHLGNLITPSNIQPAMLNSPVLRYGLMLCFILLLLLGLYF